MNAFPQNPDVVVVGAGTAGLSAARALRQAGLVTLVVEASDHIGGRCFTDMDTFSVPFDTGCSWLHSAPINPLARLAEAKGIALHKAPFVNTRVLINGSELSATDTEAYDAYQDAIWRAANHVGGTEDTDILGTLPDFPHKETAKHIVAQMMSADADLTSTGDVFNYADARGDWLVGGGLGEFVRGLHSDVPVRLNCPVSHIDYSDSRVRVETSDGIIEAAHVVLTVSTGALAAHHIRFTPDLPQRKSDAVASLPLGLLNKIGIEFDPQWREAVEGEMMDYQSADGEFCSILFGFFGSNLAVGFVAGRFADALERDGPDTAVEYCRDALKGFFGTGIEKSIRKMHQTTWRNDPFALGSYSYAQPGQAHQRAVLAESIADRVFFAGEATMPDAFATVHGAYLSGQRAAREIFAARM